ncbi:hypothetical protein S40288_02064 [Stachybotrys chartarum IBT 40288]|nr:hypothetical protein S40288_02064 [Stachybotrys chartarum IBT 40288]
MSSSENHPSSWTHVDELNASCVDDSKSRYERGALLGTGSWSQVYKVRRRSDGKVFAGKASKFQRELRKEVAVLKSLNHVSYLVVLNLEIKQLKECLQNHILRYVDWHEEKGNASATLLVMEHCTGGNLQTGIDHSMKGLSGKVILRITVQIAGALEYLHGRGQFHTDVKPRNILIRNNDPVDVVLADCADIQDVASIRRGPNQTTMTHRSPEIVQTDRHRGTGDDVWALGVTLLAMMQQQPSLPWTAKAVEEYPKKCFDHAQRLRALNPGHGTVELAWRMLAWDVRRRATATECRERAEGLLGMAEGESTGDDGTEGLGIKTPEDFTAAAFW